MNLVDRLAETKIQEAIERGELRGLPGEGRPQKLDDDSLVPPELRAGYRLLKNAGFIPPELEWWQEIRGIEQLLRCCTDTHVRRRAQQRLDLLRMQLERRGHNSLSRLELAYQEKITNRLDGS